MKNSAWSAAALAVGLVSASFASAQDVCIGDTARQEVTDCHQGPVTVSWLTENARPATQIRPAGTLPAAAARPRPRPADIAAFGAAATLEEGHQARALQIVRQEITALKQLVQATRREAPDRPEVIGRLAETYTEYQAALRNASGNLDERIFCVCPATADASCAANRAAPRNWPAPSDAECTARNGEKQTIEQELARAYNDSNRALAMLITDHPTYPNLDRIMFQLAYGLERVNQAERAQQVYLQLATRFPQSRYVPHAFIAFGDYFFNNNLMEDAQQAYERVLAFGQENNAVYGYAIFKLAWVFYNLNDYEHSLERFEQALAYGLDNPRSLAAGQMVAETRRNIVMPYAMSRGPERALRDFMVYARNDRPMAMHMYEELTMFYYDNGDWAKAINGFKLMIQQLPNDDKVCVWQSHIVDATMRSRPKAETVTALNTLVETYEAYTADQSHPVEARNACKGGTAAVIYILATQWHVEAVGGVQGADGTGQGGAGVGREVQGSRSRDTMQQAANLYELLLRSFPDLETLDFAGAHINREDLPTRYRVAYYYADLLYQSEDWRRCGPAFELVTSINPQGEYTNDAAGAAVRCYIKLYENEYEAREGQTAATGAEAATANRPAQAAPAATGRRRRRGQAAAPAPEPTPEETAQRSAAGFARREFTQLEQGMLRAFANYMCVATDGAEDLVTVKYRRARIYYESNHFEEAAILFRDIAMNHKGTRQDEFAANLYFDSLNIMAGQQQPVRPSCLATLETDSRPMCALYCSSDADRNHYGDLCRVCADLECSIKRQRAESFHTAHRYVEAANAYLDIVELNSNRPENQQCGAMDELLYNAAIDFETGYQIGMAIQVRTALIDTYPESPLKRKAIYLIGANYHAIAWYDQAATWYERFAREFPNETGADCTQAVRDEGRCPVSHAALMNATLFRLGLGDFDAAKADADLFARNYGRTMGNEVAKVQYAVGSFYEHRSNWAEVVLYYSRYVRDYARSAPPHLLLQAHALIGRAYRLEGRNDRQREMNDAYRNAVRLWESGNLAQRIAALEIPDGEKARILQDSINAAAEAYFYLAEIKFAEVQAIRFPEYHGGSTDTAITQWIQREFAPWGQRRSAAVQAAIVEYNKIRQVTATFRDIPLISAPWQIAAAARTGQMFREVVDAFRNLPIPPVVDQNPELYEVYIGALEQRAAPLLDSARDAFQFCMTSSTNARWFNEWSRQCESELARIDPAQYPPAVELRGRGGLEHVPAPWPPAVTLGTAGGNAPAAAIAPNAEGASPTPAPATSAPAAH